MIQYSDMLVSQMEQSPEEGASHHAHSNLLPLPASVGTRRDFYQPLSRALSECWPQMGTTTMVLPALRLLLCSLSLHNQDGCHWITPL